MLFLSQIVTSLPTYELQCMISYNKQISNIKLPFSMVVLFFYLLKKKYLRIHSLVSKYLQNNIVFTYLFTKSNTFINVMKSQKVLLFRSLGMLGFRKKKKNYKHMLIIY